MQIKALPFEYQIKAEGDGRTFEGHAATWDRDLENDIIHQGAFAKTIKEKMPKNQIKVLRYHDARRPIGMPMEMVEDSKGLFVRAQIARTPDGDEALELMRIKAFSNLSIGYNTVKFDMEKVDEDTRIRHLRELKLYEFSPVCFPMNENATIDAVKELLGVSGIKDEQMDRLIAALQSIGSDFTIEDKGATAFKNLPLAHRDRAWDAAAADKRVRAWAGATDAANKKYGTAFMWFDSDAAENFGSYKLGFADVIDGKLMAVPKGIFAVAGVLQGARGGVNIPDADKAKVKTHCEKYYKKMAQEFEDDSIVAPWNKENGNEPETKAGKILSAASQALVQSALNGLADVTGAIVECQANLQALLDSANPPQPDSESTEDGKAKQEANEKKTAIDPNFLQSIRDKLN